MEVYASNLDRTYILLANSTHLVAAVRVSDDKGISVRTLFEANAMQPPPALEGKANSVGTFFVKATGAEATYMVTDDAFVVAKQISAMALHRQTNNQRTHSIDGAATVSTANMDIVRQASLPTNIIDETRRAATNRNLLFQDDRVHQRNRWERALRDLQVEYTRLSQVKRTSFEPKKEQDKMTAIVEQMREIEAALGRSVGQNKSDEEEKMPPLIPSALVANPVDRRSCQS